MQKTLTRRLSRTLAALTMSVLTAFTLLLFGCKTRSVNARPNVPMSVHFLEPGSTNTVIVPVDCEYGIWTTDRGLLYLQGISDK